MQFVQEQTSSDDSDQPPNRWKHSESLEMDCVFLEDDETNRELPDVFDVAQVPMLASNHCMLCSKFFGSATEPLAKFVGFVKSKVINDKHNCNRCGK